MMYLGSNPVSVSCNTPLTELTFTLGLNPTFQEYFIPDTVTKLNLIRNGKNASYIGGRLATNILGIGSNIEEITIDYGYIKPQNAIDSLRGDYTSHLRIIHFYVDTSVTKGWDRFLFSQNSQAHNIIIDGTPIDFTNLTVWSNVLEFYGLKEIRFVPNTLSHLSPVITENANKEYSDDTWVSLCNALKSGIAGTLTVGANAVNKISTISGKNTNGIFVIDENGTLTLSNFITTIKGWTIV